MLSDKEKIELIVAALGMAYEVEYQHRQKANELGDFVMAEKCNYTGRVLSNLMAQITALAAQAMTDHDHAYLSDCCGAPESETFSGFCAQCRDHTVFSCDCGMRRLSRNDEAAAQGERDMVTHFATCPKAERFSGSKKKATP